ncbi:hypothetical protein ACTFIZ_009241 [Dictyostelium cf. discoideum]
MKIILLPNYIQNKIIKLLCYNFNLKNQSFKIKYIENSNLFESDYYLNDFNIENLIFVNWYWFKTVSNNINTIINFNYNLNKRLNFQQFLNQFKKSNFNNNENNNQKYLLINNKNINILILDFSYLFNCFKLFILMSKSKIFRKLLNEKIKLLYPNLKINNLNRQFQIDLINSIDFSNIEINNYSMQIENIDSIDAGGNINELNELNLFDIENKLNSEYKIIDKKKEKQYQIGLIHSFNFQTASSNSILKISNNIKYVNNLNFVGGTFKMISNLINQLTIIRNYSFLDSDFQSIYDNKKTINLNSLINSESFNFNYISSFKSLVTILKISPNLKTIELKFCFNHLNYIFCNDDDDDDDERNQFKECICTSTNQNSNDTNWDFIYNHIKNSKTIKKIIFSQDCNASKYGNPKVLKFCNNFQKIFNSLIENKKLKFYCLPFLKNN